MDEKYLSKSLATYTRRYSLDNNQKPGPTPADFDNYLYHLAEKVWPHVIQLIEDNFGGAVMVSEMAFVFQRYFVKFNYLIKLFYKALFRGNSVRISIANYIF